MLEISIEMKKNGEQYYRKVEKTFAINFIRLYVYYKESAKKKHIKNVIILAYAD